MIFCSVLFKLVYLFDKIALPFFSLFHLKLTDLESALLKLTDPQMNSVQEVLDDYDKTVGDFSVLEMLARKN